MKNITFSLAWAEFEKLGYQYGPDALEHVQMGWLMCMHVMQFGLLGIESAVNREEDFLSFRQIDDPAFTEFPQ